jgi:hypothetical protein
VGDDLEVRQAIVVLDSVDVVDLHAVCNGAVDAFPDDPMDHDAGAFRDPCENVALDRLGSVRRSPLAGDGSGVEVDAPTP